MSEIKYKQIGKLWFHEETKPKVCAAIKKCYDNEWVVKIYQGDVKTGKVWNEEHDRIGQISRSTGQIQIPLLVPKGERGGGGLLDHCIVGIKITDTGEWIYMHPNLQLPMVTIVSPSDIAEYKYNTLVDGELYGRHKTLEDAYMCREMLST